MRMHELLRLSSKIVILLCLLNQPAWATLATDTELEAFFGLPAGALDALSSQNVTAGSGIKQTVDSFESLGFVFNFLTDEIAAGDGVYDLAFVVSGGSAFFLADASSPGSFSPFSSSSSTIFAHETGFSSIPIDGVVGDASTIGFGVAHTGDTKVASGLVIDDIILTTLAGSSVTNEGFESGDFSGWSTIGYTSIEAAAHGGQFQALLLAPDFEVPAPAALPIFGTALVMLGFVGWRRGRRAAAA